MGFNITIGRPMRPRVGDSTTEQSEDSSVKDQDDNDHSSIASEISYRLDFHGNRFAEATEGFATYFGSRVKKLESEIRDIQRTSRLEQVTDDREPEVENPEHETPEPTCPRSVNAVQCCITPPLKVQRLHTDDLKNIAYYDMCTEASVFLGFDNPPHSSSSNYSSHTRKHSKSRTYSVSAAIPIEFISKVHKTRSTKLTRLACTSPWLTIVLELLTGQEVPEDVLWVYPFKYYVVYERQIKEFVRLLNKNEHDTFNQQNLASTLGTITKQASLGLGPSQIDSEDSNDDIEQLLRRKNIKHETRDSPSNTSLDVTGSKTDGLLKSERESMAVPPDESADSAPLRYITPREGTALRPRVTNTRSSVVCTCVKDAREHLQLLIDELDEHLTGLLTLRRAIKERSIRTIKFEDLWNLYCPGDIVVSCKLPYKSYRVMHVSGGRTLLSQHIKREQGVWSDIFEGEPRNEIHQVGEDGDLSSGVTPFKLDAIRVDFDGEYFGPCQETVCISPFGGEKRIVELDVYPIQFAEEVTLKRALLERGRCFIELKDFKHMKYLGLSLGDPQEEIDSEVIVDFKQAFRQPGYDNQKPKFGIKNSHGAGSCILDDTELDKLWTNKFLGLEGTGNLLANRHKSQPLTEDQIMLLPGRAHAFSLRKRKWVELNIDHLSHIEYGNNSDGHSTAFEDLVIPDEYKKTVKALVRSHVLGSQDADSHGFDLIRGKGKGLIILLHGVPGVGKTSTAESVATYTKRPLFPITCGDIGQTANEVEKNLEEIFLLARKWGCVLLLDEANVFLEKRERGGSSINRNALVSVFLRTLEYYSGILFLTTNRIGSFDEAFISRIHISLYYAELDKDSTYKIWMMNLKRLKESGRNIFVSEEQIRAFAKDHWRLGKDGSRWNGRQIRNAFQTAVALAEYDFHEKCKMCEQTGEKMPLMPALLPDHFRAVAKTSAEFENYLLHVQGGATHKEKARLAELRRDDWEDQGEETSVGKKYNNERAVRPK